MTVVYVLMSAVDYEGETLLGVYTTQDAAIAAVAEHPDPDADDHEIYPVALDGIPTPCLVGIGNVDRLRREWRERAAAGLVDVDPDA